MQNEEKIKKANIHASKLQHPHPGGVMTHTYSLRVAPTTHDTNKKENTSKLQ